MFAFLSKPGLDDSRFVVIGMCRGPPNPALKSYPLPNYGVIRKRSFVGRLVKLTKLPRLTLD